LNFLTNESWQIQDPILCAFHHDRERLYPCVEVELNRPLWHLDLETCFGENFECWRRFIFTSVEPLIAALSAHDGEQRLHVQTPRRPGHPMQPDYEISPVQALSIGYHNSGRSAYIVALSSSRFIYPDLGVPEGELQNVRKLYGRID
jgi:hypothetical protein